MIKRIILFIIAIFIIFGVSYTLNTFILDSNSFQLTYSLLSVYLFHSISAIIIYTLIELITEHVPDQAGYGYLAAITIKLGLFLLIFQTDILSNDNLTKPERLSLIAPLFIFITTEAFAIFKLLNSK